MPKRITVHGVPHSIAMDGWWLDGTVNTPGEVLTSQPMGFTAATAPRGQKHENIVNGAVGEH